MQIWKVFSKLNQKINFKRFKNKKKKRFENYKLTFREKYI